jgi:acyl-CoA synthetase (AMP-forming)/AMP-acid ligase II
MSLTILRTADAWWVRNPSGAARIDTDATTTGELLAEPEKIEGPDGPLLDDMGRVRDGWLDTGDLARLDDGFVYLVGRAKDLIIRGGHNIDPAVIENTFLAHALRGVPCVSGPRPLGRSSQTVWPSFSDHKELS